MTIQNQTKTMRVFSLVLALFAFVCAFAPMVHSAAFTASRTWTKGAATFDWNTAGNWTGGVPDTSTERVLFTGTNPGTITTSALITAHSIVFSGGSSYVISPAGGVLNLNGTGIETDPLIANTSGQLQTIAPTLNQYLLLKTGTVSDVTLTGTGGSVYINTGASVTFDTVNATFVGTAAHHALLDVQANVTLTNTGNTLIFNKDANAGIGILSLFDGAELIGGNLVTTGGYLDAQSSTLTDVTVTNTGNALDTRSGYVHLLTGETVTLAGTTTITNNATAGGTQGYIRLGNGSTLSGGTVNNTGGYTHTDGDATLTNVTMTNTADANGTAGYLDIRAGDTLTLTNGSSITSLFANGTEGYTRLNAGSRLIGGTLATTGGYTFINGDTTLTNVTVTNTPDVNDVVGYMDIASGDTLTLTGTSSITNLAANGARGYTYLVSPATLSGGALTNTGGYARADNGTFTDVTLRNRIDGNGTIGYFASDGTNGNSTFDAASTFGFDVNSTTAAFAIVHDGATLALPSNTVTLYVDTSATYTNAVRTLIYGETGDADLTDPTTVVIKDLSGTTITSLTATLDTETRDATTSGALGAAEVYNGNLQSLLKITLNTIIPGLSEPVQNTVRSVAASTTTILAKARQATHNIVRGITRHVASKSRASGGSGSKGSSERRKETYLLGSSFFHAPSLDGSSFLNATEGMMNATAQETADLMAPLRTEKSGIWFQPFGQYVDQGSTSSGLGHKSKTAGLVFGIDHKISANTLIGAAIGSSQSTSETRDGSKSLIKDKFITLFSTWFKNNWFVETLLTYSHNRFRSSRKINANTLANNTHNGYQLVPSIGGGRTFDLNEAWSTTPFANATLLYGSEKGYNEENAGANNLTVGDRCSSQLRTQFGSDFIYNHTHNFGKGTYGIGVSMIVEDPLKKGGLNGTTGGSSFNVSANDKTTVKGALNLSSNWALHTLWDLNLNYAGEYGTRYHAHEVAFKLRRKL